MKNKQAYKVFVEKEKIGKLSFLFTDKVAVLYNRHYRKNISKKSKEALHEAAERLLMEKKKQNKGFDISIAMVALYLKEIS